MRAEPVIAARRGWHLAVLLSGLGAALGIVLAGADAHSHWWWLHWICKPLTTVLIFAIAWAGQPPVSSRYRRWVLVGIVFSLFGDVFLMLPQDLFIGGLLAFLLAHLCFLCGFLGDSRFAVHPRWMLVCAGYGVVNLWGLWPYIAPGLRIPVIVYVAVLAGMAGQALVRTHHFAQHGDPRLASARRAAIGALLFLASDSLLAWDRFYAPIPLAGLWVLSTYYLSLWWIARSVRRDPVPYEVKAAP